MKATTEITLDLSFDDLQINIIKAMNNEKEFDTLRYRTWKHFITARAERQTHIINTWLMNISTYDAESRTIYETRTQKIASDCFHLMRELNRIMAFYVESLSYKP